MLGGGAAVGGAWPAVSHTGSRHREDGEVDAPLGAWLRLPSLSRLLC